ncbi:ParA family protein [Ursidibacter arcticus]
MNKKYAIWNNKGGVGKTFLTYALSVEYALANPDENIIVIDACPQANVSEIILGGNGEGEEKLASLVNNNNTIAGYIKERFNSSQFSRLGTEAKYFIKADTHNPEMPKNLFLLSGDIDLDLCSRIISHIGGSPRRESWKTSRSLLIDLIDSFEKVHATKKNTFFIDCNPSFSNYTELAILASNRLIVPCTADAASIRGIKNLIKLIYGLSIENEVMSDDFLDFNKEATIAAFDLPEIHLFIQNRSRTSDKSATKAYQAHADEIANMSQNISSTHSNIFTNTNLRSRIGHVKDGNTLAAIINNKGLPISSLKHQKYDIYGKETQANQEQIDTLKNDIKSIVDEL